MAQEIERKFLVNTELWHPKDAGTSLVQGYLASQNGMTVRVRIAGEQGFLTIKGPTNGISRREYEYPIPLNDAKQLLMESCAKPLVCKTRYVEQIGVFQWEIDVFSGRNQGLVVAEIELPAEDTPFERPAWARKEVSADRRYRNSNLIRHPFDEWCNDPDPVPGEEAGTQ